MEIAERPAGYVGANLDPSRLAFRTRKFTSGVYGLLARPQPRDNAGLIAGRDAALMIDAGINGKAAQKLQAVAAHLTDRPLRHLVNSCYRGDHSFGNYAFPPSVEIIAHHRTAERMRDLGAEKRRLSANLFSHKDALADVTVWRAPDLLFNDRLEIDLGGRRVQLWHFGPGATAGDTIVYEPQSRVAWTGDFVGAILPVLLESDPLTWLESLTRFKNTLDVDVIVPGHGPLAGRGAADRAIGYLYALQQDVARVVEKGLSAEAAVEVVPIRREFRRPWWNIAPLLRGLEWNFHRLNVLSVWRRMTAPADVREGFSLTM